MKRRTSALSVSAAALLVTVPLLTGCSSDSHPGAAAVVGDEQISLSHVQSQVENVRTAQRDQPDADELIAGTGQLGRETVNRLVAFQIVEQAAEKAGVEVSRRDVQQERGVAEQFAGGSEALQEGFLRNRQGPPLAEDQIDSYLRYGLLLQGLREKLSEDMDENEAPTEQDVDQRLVELLAETGEDLGVEVNPRYGEWDPEFFSLSESELPWLRPEVPQDPTTLPG